MKHDPNSLQQPSLVDLNDLSKNVTAPAIANGPTEENNVRAYVSPKLFRAAALTLDPLLVGLIGYITAWTYLGSAAIDHPYVYVAIVLVAMCGQLALFEGASLYRLNVLLAPVRQLPTMTICWSILIGAIIGGVFLLKVSDYVSRAWLIGFALSGILVIFVGRFLLAAIMRRLNTNGQLNRRAVLVGGGEPARRVISVINESVDSGIKLVGIFDDRLQNRTTAVEEGLPRLGTIDDLIDFVRASRVDVLIVTLPIPAEDRLLQILNRLWILPVDIRLSANGQKLHYRPRAYSYIGNLPCLDVYDKPLGDWGPILKAANDKIIAAALIVLLAPVMAAVALAVKLGSKGPVLFKQNRFGFNNELIEVYKFRSMYTDLADKDAAKLVSKDDSRVTKVGRFIRRTSLDELPQLFNVLKGDLSLVGPRPHATKAKAGEELYEHVVDGYFARHRVRPGITGWAQINGWRGETDTAEKIERRVEHDLYYIDNWSLTFDLYILARTPFALLNTDNAF